MLHTAPWLQTILEWFQTASDLVGLSIIVVGLSTAAGRWVLVEVGLLRHRGDGMRRWSRLHGVRVFLGTYILMGLEFMIVSDIIHSFLHPELEGLYVLGLVVVIRTAISFFLEKEIAGARESVAAGGA